MNWAFDRETTREEVVAYCLQEIFDINMPLLYGEGPKAFMRLQDETMKHEHDYTFFLWGLPSHPQSEVLVSVNEEVKTWESTTCLIWNPPRAKDHTCNYRGPFISKWDCETRLGEVVNKVNYGSTRCWPHTRLVCSTLSYGRTVVSCIIS